MSEGQKAFEVHLTAFSGPLDLLCHLIESREVNAADINITDLVSQYVAFALQTNRATLQEMADFFFMASRLILGKVKALFPAQDPPAASEEEDFEEEYGDEENSLIEALERFRPYRRAVNWLVVQQTSREQHFLRITEDDGPPWFDIGDLFALARLWWSTIEEYRQRKRSYAEDDTDYFLDEIPDAVPEEVLVEQRMDQIMAYLNAEEKVFFSQLFRDFPTSSMIVTLLAMLELSRLGKIDLNQETEWGDVCIAVS